MPYNVADEQSLVDFCCECVTEPAPIGCGCEQYSDQIQDLPVAISSTMPCDCFPASGRFVWDRDYTPENTTVKVGGWRLRSNDGTLGVVVSCNGTTFRLGVQVFCDQQWFADVVGTQLPPQTIGGTTFLSIPCSNPSKPGEFQVSVAGANLCGVGNILLSVG